MLLVTFLYFLFDLKITICTVLRIVVTFYQSLENTLMLSLSKGPNRVDVSFPSPEDGNRSSLRNVVFSSYLEFRTMDEVHKPMDFESYTPPLEPFRIH
jgi:hypothetical protein